MVPDDFPSYWDVEVLAEEVDEILVRIVPPPPGIGNPKHPAIGRSAWVFRSELCTDNAVHHKGDRGLMAIAGWVAESNDWM